MNVAELFREKQITRRAYHVCKGNNIDTILDLQKYYFENGNFNKFKSCGKNTNTELLALLSSFEEKIEIANDGSQLRIFTSIFSTSTKAQKKLTDSLILIITKNLTTRTKNAVSNFLEEDFSIDNFLIKIFENKDFRISQIKDIGETSILELETYLNTVKSIAITVIKN